MNEGGKQPKRVVWYDNSLPKGDLTGDPQRKSRSARVNQTRQPAEHLLKAGAPYEHLFRIRIAAILPLLTVMALKPAVVPVPTEVTPQKIPGAKPRNIVFILTDDHRFDAMGFMGHPFLETPYLDSLARSGAHVPNAFVTTAAVLAEPRDHPDRHVCAQAWRRGQ